MSFDWPSLLHKLSRREDLSEEDTAGALTDVMEGNAAPVHLGAFLVGLRTKGETAAEMTGLVKTMLRFATPVEIAGPLLDTCGTGGDRAATLNVSTLAALVAAGAGARVAKHGNRSASGLCGSADLFEALGVNLELDPEGVARCIDEAGIGFCFAPRFHPAMRFAGPVRKELGIPTVMNVLGPLTNPARAQFQLVGVSDPSLGERMISVLKSLGKQRALVVHGHDGLDELTTRTTSTVWELRDDEMRSFEVDPSTVGVPVPKDGELDGGALASCLDIARRLLDGEKGGARDIVTLNAAAALMVAGLADRLIDGIEMAQDSIDTGRAASALEAMGKASREA